MQKELFADDLGGHETQGSGGNLVLGELRGPFGQFGADQGFELRQAVPTQGRGRKDVGPGPHFVQAGQQGQHPAFVAEQVHLVDHHDHGPLVAGQGFGHRGQIPVQKFRVPDVKMGIQNGHDHVRLTEALPDRLDHGFAQTAAHLGQARRIHKDDLGLLVSENAYDLIARGLGFGRDNGHFLAQQGVQQRGFSGIGRAHERHPAATIGMIRHYLLPGGSRAVRGRR